MDRGAAGVSEASPVPRFSLRLWVAALLAVLFAPPLALVAMQRLEPVVADRVVTALRGRVDGPLPIVVVAITEDTLASLAYRSPIDRAFLAGLISRLDRAGPRAIGLDVLVDQPSEPEKDQALLAAIDGAKTPVIMGFATRADGLTVRQAEALATVTDGRRAGLVTLRRDGIDGVVRRRTLGRSVDGNWVPSLAVAMAGKGEARAHSEVQRLIYAVDAAGQPYRFPVYPAHAASVLPDRWFAGKYVLIGSDLPEVDRHGTPFLADKGSKAGTLPGVVIHAHMLAQALSGETIVMASPLARIAFAFLIGGLACLLFVSPMRPWVRFAGVVALIGLYGGAALWLIARGDVQIPLLTPPLAAALCASALAFVHWHRDWSEHRFIKSAFSRYVSPEVVERIAAHRMGLTLGGEKRLVTYVFTDLEGFTALSERLPAGEVAAILNAYLDQLCDLFTTAEATIDKIVGDAVIGFFGAPAEQPDQAARAIALALAIDRFSQTHREMLAARGITIGATRIGVHKGEAIVGNFGGSRFFDYTGVGDTVNTAARLEGANKYLGTRLLVSDHVVRDDPDHAFRPAACLRLKGRDGDVVCHSPINGADKEGAWLADYRAGYAALDAGRDDEAAAAFDRVLAAAPGDALSRFHRERLRRGETGTLVVLQDK